MVKVVISRIMWALLRERTNRSGRGKLFGRRHFIGVGDVPGFGYQLISGYGGDAQGVVDAARWKSHVTHDGTDLV
jgi:hypothetical protein